MSRLTLSCSTGASEALGVASGGARCLARRIALGLALSSVALAAVALSAPVFAAKDADVRRHPGYVDGSGFARLAGEDSELVEVNIGPSLLKAIARGADDDPDARSVLSGLLSVNAYIVELDGSAATESRAAKMIAEIVDSLERSGWERLVKVRDKSETVNVYVRNGEVTIDGLVVLVFDRNGKEVVFANLVGSIDLARLGELDGTLDIPGLDAIGDAGGKAPKSHGTTPAPKPDQDTKSKGSRGDAMRGDAMRGDAMRGDAMQSDATQRDAVHGDAIQSDATQRDAMRGDAMQSDATQRDAVRDQQTQSDAVRGDASGDAASPADAIGDAS